jgi:hypothetical protein
VSPCFTGIAVRSVVEDGGKSEREGAVKSAASPGSIGRARRDDICEESALCDGQELTVTAKTAVKASST